jgi:phosphoglycolate phosphatase-like HAD superfamily hydrolase
MLKAAAAHREALLHAIREVHQVQPEVVEIQTAGRTDADIARQLLMHAGVDAGVIDRLAEDVRDAACAAYARLCPDDLSPFVAPGAPEVLEELASSGDHTLSLVTGNFESIARLKLGRAGLGAWFPRGQGGFGSHHEDRAVLPTVARRRAGRPDQPHPREDTVVIGDTPLDIACARADGVHCIAVATGPYHADDLRGADTVVASATELPAALASL